MTILHRDIDRRGFLKTSAAGLTLALTVNVDPTSIIGEAAADTPLSLTAWVTIATDGAITIVSPPAELGQGTFTALAAVLADELDADWSMVKIAYPPVWDEKTCIQCAKCAVICPHACIRIKPYEAVRALADEATAAGVRFVERAEVFSVSSAPGGKRVMKTTAGDFVGEQVVLAAGAWSEDLGRMLDVEQHRRLVEDVEQEHEDADHQDEHLQGDLHERAHQEGMARLVQRLRRQVALHLALVAPEVRQVQEQSADEARPERIGLAGIEREIDRQVIVVYAANSLDYMELVAVRMAHAV